MELGLETALVDVAACTPGTLRGASGESLLHGLGGNAAEFVRVGARM